MAKRPTDFRNQERMYKVLTEGLTEDKRLGPAEGDAHGISLTTWIAQLEEAFDIRGLDTVFRIYNPDTGAEVYMLDKKAWGRIKKSDVTAWL
jgi:hypothetical protein